MHKLLYLKHWNTKCAIISAFSRGGNLFLLFRYVFFFHSPFAVRHAAMSIDISFCTVVCNYNEQREEKKCCVQWHPHETSGNWFELILGLRAHELTSVHPVKLKSRLVSCLFIAQKSTNTYNVWTILTNTTIGYNNIVAQQTVAWIGLFGIDSKWTKKKKNNK